jgi:hypothetical protein
VLAIMSSAEYRLKRVNDQYVRFLRRPASTQELNKGVQLLQQGGTVEQLQAMILGSPEYFVRRGRGTIAGFLNALSVDVLPGPLGQHTTLVLSKLLSSGQASRSDVAALLLTSRPGRVRQVEGYYQTFLRRLADPVGLSKSVDALLRGLRSDLLIATLVSSNEYLARLGS